MPALRAASDDIRTAEWIGRSVRLLSHHNQADRAIGIDLRYRHRLDRHSVQISVRVCITQDSATHSIPEVQQRLAIA